MAETAFLAWLYLSGAAVVIGSGAVRSGIGVAVTALPAGFVLYTLVGVAFLVTNLPFIPLLIVGVSVPVLVLLTIASNRPPLDRRTWLCVGAGLTTVMLGSALFQQVHLTQLHGDSLDYLGLASYLERTQHFSGLPEHVFMRRSPVTALMYTGFGGDAMYLASIGPLFTFAGVGCLVWLGREAHRDVGAEPRRSWALLGACVLLLVTAHHVQLQAFLLNSHVVFAVLMLLFAAPLWIGVTRRDWRLVVAVSPVLAIVELARPEAPLFLAAFLVPVIVRVDVPARVRGVLTGTFIATAVLWHGVTLSRHLEAGPADPAVVGPLVAALGLGVLWTMTQIGRFPGWLPQVPRLTVIALGLGLAMFVILEPLAMGVTVVATALNVIDKGFWGATWIVLGPLLTVAVLRFNGPFRSFWSTGLLGFLAIFLMLGVLRGGAYRFGFTDSGNRILMHVVFVALFFLAVWALTPRSGDADPGASRLGDSSAAGCRQVGSGGRSR